MKTKYNVSNVNINNYVRAGEHYYFFDDKNELDTRRAWSYASEWKAPVVAYKMPTCGWFTYMQGSRVILPCPEHLHNYRTIGGVSWCVRCMLKEDDDEGNSD